MTLRILNFLTQLLNIVPISNPLFCMIGLVIRRIWVCKLCFFFASWLPLLLTILDSVRLEAWRRKKKHTTFLFASFSVFFLFLSAYILEHAFFFNFHFFLSTLLAIVCSNLQFANNCRTRLVGGPEMTASSSWSPFSEIRFPGPRGSLSQPLHIRNSHTSLWSLLPIFFNVCDISMFHFCLLNYSASSQWFLFLFIFSLVLPRLWNLSSPTRDQTHGPSISAEP